MRCHQFFIFFVVYSIPLLLDFKFQLVWKAPLVFCFLVFSVGFWWYVSAIWRRIVMSSLYIMLSIDERVYRCAMCIELTHWRWEGKSILHTLLGLYSLYRNWKHFHLEKREEKINMLNSVFPRKRDIDGAARQLLQRLYRSAIINEPRVYRLDAVFSISTLVGNGEMDGINHVCPGASSSSMW